MDLTYEEKKSIVLNKIQEHINEKKAYNSSYIEPEILFSTTQGSVYLNSSQGKNVVNAKSLFDLRGSGIRFKHIREQKVNPDYTDIRTFISKEDADELSSWIHQEIGPFVSVIGKEFDPKNVSKTINVSFIPKEGLVPFEWSVTQPTSCNIKLNIDSKNRDNSTITINPIVCKYFNGELVREDISTQSLPGFHIGHPIKEVYKEKDYFFNAVMVQTLSEKEFTDGNVHYDNYKYQIESETYPIEKYNKYKQLNEEINLLKKSMGSMSKEEFKEKGNQLKNEIKRLNVKEPKMVSCPKGISDIIESQKKEKEKTKEDLEL